MPPSWDDVLQTFNDFYDQVLVPEDAHLNVYFYWGGTSILVQEVIRGHGDMVLVRGDDPVRKARASALTNLSSLTLICRTEKKAPNEQPSPRPTFRIGFDLT
jgi:hypothetical protein